MCDVVSTGVIVAADDDDDGFFASPPPAFYHVIFENNTEDKTTLLLKYKVEVSELNLSGQRRCIGVLGNTELLKS